MIVHGWFGGRFRVIWSIQFLQRWSWSKSDTQPFPWIAPGRLAVNQTIGLPPRARDDFVHILDIFDIFNILSTLSTFLDAALADLGIWARVWQTDKRRDNLTDRRRGRQRHHSASPTNLDRQQIQVTIHKYRICDNPQIQDPPRQDQKYKKFTQWLSAFDIQGAPKKVLFWNFRFTNPYGNVGTLWAVLDLIVHRSNMVRTDQSGSKQSKRFN